MTLSYPFSLFRKYVRAPVERFILDQYSGYKKRTEAGFNSARELIYRVLVISVFVTAILWISIFFYVVFYYAYMPNVTHMRPVHFQFKLCKDAIGTCSFPSAYVQLTKWSSILMADQPYRVRLVLDMPESQVNKDIGMFMVCAQMRGKGGVLVSSSCRSAMLRHRSPLHQIMRTLVFAPLLLSGLDEEKQQLQVELFTDFEDSKDKPVTDAYVELQSRHAQVYSCELQIEAHFSGLRYLMYNWPKLAAAVGISTNLFFVSLIFLLSWYHLQDGLPEFIKMKPALSVTMVKEEDLFTGKLNPAPPEDMIKDDFLTGKVKLERGDSPTFDSFFDELLSIEKTDLERNCDVDS